jgi:hypothetical protein
MLRYGLSVKLFLSATVFVGIHCGLMNSGWATDKRIHQTDDGMAIPKRTFVIRTENYQPVCKTLQLAYNNITIKYLNRAKREGSIILSDFESKSPQDLGKYGFRFPAIPSSEDDDFRIYRSPEPQAQTIALRTYYTGRDASDVLIAFPPGSKPAADEMIEARDAAYHFYSKIGGSGANLLYPPDLLKKAGLSARVQIVTYNFAPYILVNQYYNIAFKHEYSDIILFKIPYNITDAPLCFLTLSNT